MSRLRDKTLPLLLASLSGAAGLAHQLVWVRRMVDVLGAQDGTFTRVIGAFFLGLSGGAWFAARTRTPRPWRGVAIAEACVALLAAVMMFAGPRALALQNNTTLVTVLPWMLPLVLVAPPAFAMGTVLPWMIRATSAKSGVSLYAANTVAGIGGLLLVTFWALPNFGLTGAGLCAIVLNLGVALIALFLRETREAAPVIAKVSTDMRSGQQRAVCLMAFASGLLVLAGEVILQHQFAQVLASSHLSSAAVLTFVLVALGAGALCVPLFARLREKAMPVVFALAAVAFAVQPFVFIVLRGGLVYLDYAKPPAAYTWEAVKLGLPACVLPLIAAAAVFPLLLRTASGLGMDAGRLFAWNGLGGWLGAEFAERFLAPRFGLWWPMSLLAAAYAGCVLLHKGALRWWLAPVAAACVIGSWKIDARLPFAGLSKEEKLLAVGVGREGVVGVVQGEPDDLRIIFNNNYTLGGSRAQVNQERQMLLPVILHGHAETVAALGVATGCSLGGATLDPSVKHAEGIELSPLVQRFAAEHFAPYNRGIGNGGALVSITHGDARIVIAQRRGAFDVIEGDLFLPWRTGEGRLFSREHFENVRDALRPGGIYCQWLPVFQLTRTQFEVIARTFAGVFPDAWIVRGDFYVERPILGLIGGRSLKQTDWSKVREACERVRLANLSHDPLMRHVEGIAMSVIGPLGPAGEGPVNTLSNSWIEWDAARNLIGLREPWFTGVPFATHVRDTVRNAHALLPDDLRDDHERAVWFHALEIAEAARLPVAAQLRAQASAHLPSAMRGDRDADWKTWPMHYRPSF